MRRDKCSRQLAEAKVASQMPLERKAALADHVLDNSGDRATLESQAGCPSRLTQCHAVCLQAMLCSPCCDCPGARIGEQVEAVRVPARAPDVPSHCGCACVACACSVYEKIRLPGCRVTHALQHRPCTHLQPYTQPSRTTC